MKKPIRTINFLLFVVSLFVLIFLQSSTHISTSLFSVLPEGNAKKMIEGFQEIENNNILLVAVKGFDQDALKKMKSIEKELHRLPLVSIKTSYSNKTLQAHEREYKLFVHDINKTKISTLNVSKALAILHTEMTTSFFPVQIDTTDPFNILNYPPRMGIQMKNAHLTLGTYGYISYFTLESKNLDMHQVLYADIHKVLLDKLDIQFFSPMFYYVENTEAIRSDVHQIIYISMAVLLLLYFIILRDIVLLIHTFTTLATSAIIATLVLTQMYEQVSVFVFVFGISISTVAIDYMFHHYLHGYYSEDKKFNKAVLFGFLTTLLAFFILSFTSFLLIKQISLFAIISLLVSYLHFAFLYPKIGFKKPLEVQKSRDNSFCNIHPILIFIVSIVVIIASLFWITFDSNLKNLDYDNQTLKKTETFFTSQMQSNKSITFAIKAKSIDTLISHCKTIQRNIPSSHMPLASLVSKQSYENNIDLLSHLRTLKIDKKAQALGFIEGYFKDTYADKPFVNYTESRIKKYGINIMRINDAYVTFGRVDEAYYSQVLSYPFVQSLSIKDNFEVVMQDSLRELGLLGIWVVLMIVGILFSIAQRKIVVGIVFLVFPLAMMGLYAFFMPINILHLFMLFVILAIGIDYAIYMTTQNDLRTKKAISYSLISTFSGFGVLVFSQINALFSMGIIATIGILSIYILLLCMRKKYEKKFR